MNADRQTAKFNPPPNFTAIIIIIIDLNIHTTIGAVGHTNTQYDYHYNAKYR